MHKRFLVFFTQFFPYGYREPYLLNEIRIFSEHFTKIYILVLHKEGKQHVQLPENVIVVHFPRAVTFLDKIKGFTFLFSSLLREEMRIQSRIFERRLRIVEFLEMLSFLGLASACARFLKRFSVSNRIPLHKTIFFNNVFDEYSLALAMLSSHYRVKGVFSRYQTLQEVIHKRQHHLHLFRTYGFKNLDATFFPSEFSLLFAAEHYGFFDSSKMMVMRPGTEPVEVVHILPRRKNKIKLVSISFIEKYKRVDNIIDALEIIDGFDIDWHHIGDGNHVGSLNQKAFNRLFSKKNVTFRFTGNSTGEALRKILSSEKPDVFISLSEAEDVPISILEAMSFAIPAISTNVGGISEIIKDGENGFLLPANPANKEISDVLKRIVDLPEEEWSRIRQNSLEAWQRLANASIQYQDLCYLLLQMSRNYES